MKTILNLFVFALLTLTVGAFIGADSVVELGVVALGLGAMSLAIPFEKGYALMALPLSQARAVFTQNTVQVFREKVSVSTFLTSFFTVKVKRSKLLSIEVQRGTEKIAVDVQVNSKGNRNVFTKSTQKVFAPPYFHEYFTLNDNDLYDTAIGSQDPGDMAILIEDSASKMEELTKKIMRSVEKMCGEVFTTGIVTLTAGVGNIDFKRKAASMVAYAAGTDFAINTVNPYTVIKNGCQWIQENGKSSGNIFNVIMGGDVAEAFLGNTLVQNRADIRNFSMDTVGLPQKNAEGGVYLGQVSAGPYIVRLWSYNGSYVNASGVRTYYINQKDMVILPSETNYDLAYAMVRQLIKDGQVPQAGEYLWSEYMDERETSHEMHVKSAPLPIPVAVDTIYTLRVLNG